MSLDGVVYRSSGKSTVWINQHAQNENDARRTGVTATLSPRDPGRALIAPGEDVPARLKVGEAVNRATGERNTHWWRRDSDSRTNVNKSSVVSCEEISQRSGDMPRRLLAETRGKKRIYAFPESHSRH